MSEQEVLRDKKLYSYKQALSQPYWIQRFNDQFSLRTPVKFSRLVYFVIFSGLIWGVLSLFSFTAFGFRLMATIFVSWFFSGMFSDMVIDGKSFFMYVKDYLSFYFKYGVRGKDIYINRGQVYQKPKGKKR